MMRRMAPERTSRDPPEGPLFNPVSVRRGGNSISYYDLATGKCPCGVPSAFWGSMWWVRSLLRLTSIIILLGFAASAIALLIDPAAFWDVLDRYGITILAIVVVVHSTTMLVGVRAQYKRFTCLLIQYDWLLCPECGYSLEHLPSNHACPECGTKYLAAAVKAMWKAWAERNQWLK